MSLIDDALKRAREEASRQETGRRGGGSRWAPSHIPGRRGGRSGAALGFAAVFLAGVAAAWLFLARRGPASLPAAEFRRETGPAPPSAGRAAEKSSVPVAPREESNAPKPLARPERRRTGESGRAPASSPSSPAGAAGPSPAVVPLPRDSAASPAPAGRSYVREAKVGGESIELGGIVFSESNPVALINGRVVSPGSLVGNFTVVRIRPEGVDFSGDGIAFSILLR